MKRIIIDGEEFFLPDEKANQLKEELAQKTKVKFKYKKNPYKVDLIYVGKVDNFKDIEAEAGLYRKTLKNARLSSEQLGVVARLQALVEQIQGDLSKGDYYIYNDKGRWLYEDTPSVFSYPETVLMERGTAEKICDILNNGQFKL